MALESINWEKHPLLPAIAQDSLSGEILMLAYMNKEALELTLSTQIAHYFSRSKNRLWKKGESSGNIQRVQEVWLDCDSDTILLKVEQVGGSACHTGERSCFFQRIDTPSESPRPARDMSEVYGVVDTLYHELLSRRHGDPSLSYTAKLFCKGENTIGKKIVEEAAELSFAIKDKNPDEIIYEATDLLYHALVGLAFCDIAPDRIKQELQRRRGTSGIAEKNARQDS